METPQFERWWVFEAPGLCGPDCNQVKFASESWNAATKRAATVARECCEVYGAEFANEVYKKVMEGNEHAS